MLNQIPIVPINTGKVIRNNTVNIILLESEMTFEYLTSSTARK